jgi:hypothetical protein
VARRKLSTDEQPEPSTALVIKPSTDRKRGKLIDPYAPVPGDIERINEPSNSLVLKDRSERRILSDYAQQLVRFGGDPVPAIAATYRIDQTVVEENLSHYLSEMARIAAATSPSDLFQSLDVTVANRLAVLRDSLYSKKEGPRLKAIELLGDIEHKLGDSQGSERLEDYVRLALASTDIE